MAGADDDSLRDGPRIELYDRTQAFLCATTGELYCAEKAAPGDANWSQEQLMYETRVRPSDAEQRNNITRQLVTCAATGESFNAATADDQEKGKAHVPLPRAVVEANTTFTFPRNVKERLLKQTNFGSAKSTIAKVEKVEELAPQMQKLAFAAAYAWDAASHAAEQLRIQMWSLLKKIEEAPDLATAKSVIETTLTEQQYAQLREASIDSVSTQNSFLRNAMDTSTGTETPAERVTRAIAWSARDFSVTTWAKAERALLPDLPEVIGTKHKFDAIPQDDMNRLYSATKAKHELEQLSSKAKAKKPRFDPQKKDGGWRKTATSPRKTSGDTNRPSAKDRLGDEPKWIPAGVDNGGSPFKPKGRGRGRGRGRGAPGRH